jgi:SynChlorMet cassette protein ScmC
MDYWIIMQKTKAVAKNFGLKLANEEIWQFISTFEASEWLDKISAIMGLNEYTEENGHKIVFSKNISDESNVIKSLTSNGTYLFNKGPLSIHQCQNSSNMICEIGNEEFPESELLKMAQSVFPLYMRVLSQGGLPLHAALIERGGIGIAISAPGGTGKSTCARRIPLPWKAMCDDEVLIVPDRKNAYHAHPFPTWSRCNNKQEPKETWDVPAHVPISAIFFLKQSQKDEVTSLSFSQSASLIYKLSLPPFYYRLFDSIDESECTTIKKLIFENACEIAKDIPSFILEASLTGKFWETIDRALSINSKGDCVNAKTSSHT